ncbi:MAG: DUF4339 domain-containing protein [Verrucomicrobia bacterium]|nr:DUF4339 domain-containing protein [Verrucomicrobiota bacterium]
MYKIIGGDHKEYGPIDAEQIRQWIAEGRLSGQSPAQSEGRTEWKPLSQFPEFASALGTQASRLPVPPSTVSNPEVFVDQILARQPDLQIGSCLTRSWRLMTDNTGLLFGASFLTWLMNLVTRFIPIIGSIIYLLLTGALLGGLYLIFLKRIRNQPASASDVFAGFGPGFAQLMLAGLLTAILTGIGWMLCLVPGVYLLIAWKFSVPLVADKRLEFWPAMELSRKVVTRIWFQVFVLMLVAFLPFVLFEAYAAAKTSMAIFSMFSSSTTGGFDFTRIMELVKVSASMTLFSQLVLFLNLPFALGALMYAYEDIFGARTTAAP